MLQNRKDRLMVIHAVAFVVILGMFLGLFFGMRAYYAREPEERWAIPEACMWTRMERVDKPEGYALVYTRDTWYLLNSLLESGEVSPVDAVPEDWVWRIMLSEASDGAPAGTYELLIGRDSFSMTKGSFHPDKRRARNFIPSITLSWGIPWWRCWIQNMSGTEGDLCPLNKG